MNYDILLCFKGIRLNSKDQKSYHYYVVNHKNKEEEGTTFIFKTKINKYESVGTFISCNIKKENTYNNFIFRTNVNVNYVSKEQLKTWSIENRASLETLELIKATKIKIKEDLDVRIKSIIKDINNTNISRQGRKSLALYIYSKII